MALNKTLILHVGTDKTGTSALQRLFSRNPEIFQQAGIYYPETGRGNQHQHHLLFVPICSFADKAGFATDVSWAESLESLAAEVEVRPEQRILLSSELLTQGINFPALAELRDMFADLCVVLYLRRQDHYVMSRYEQSVKTLGACEPLEVDPASIPDYWKMAQEWEAFAGSPDRLIVRPYEKAQFHGGTIYVDFLHHALGMAFDDGFVLPDNRDTNPRFHPDAVEFLRLANRRRQPRGAVSLLWHLTGYSLRETPGTLEPFTRRNPMAPGERHEILDRCRAGNARVAERYLGRKDGALFADYTGTRSDARDGSRRLAPDACLDIARYLITSLAENPAISPADSFRDMRLVETLVAEVLGGRPGDGTGQQLLADFRALLREKEIHFIERQAADQGNALAMKDEYISQQDHLIGSLQAAVDETSAALRQKDDFIAQQQGALERQADALHQKDDVIAQQQQALEGLAETLGELQGRAAEMETYLSALRGRLTWRMLAPVLRLPAMPDKKES